jgi:hypothetical protein
VEELNAKDNTELAKVDAIAVDVEFFGFYHDVHVSCHANTHSPLATITQRVGQGVVANLRRCMMSTLMKLVVEPESRKATTRWP